MLVELELVCDDVREVVPEVEVVLRRAEEALWEGGGGRVYELGLKDLGFGVDSE